VLVGTCTCQPKIGDVDYMFKETGRAGNFMMGRYFAGLLAVQVQLKGEATKFAANFVHRPWNDSYRRHDVG